MKSTIFSLVVVLLLAVTSAFGQVLLVDGSVNPGQIPDALAYRQVINYTQTPTQLSAFAKEGTIFTNQSDIVTFENVTASFPAVEQQQNRATRDSMTMAMVSQLLQSLTPTGAVQFSSFEQQFKSYMQIYGGAGDDAGTQGYSTTFMVTANNVSYLDADWNTFISIEGSQYEFCSVNPVSTTITYQNVSANGTVQGLYSSATLTVPDQSTTLPTQLGEPGAGVVYEFTATFVTLFTSHECVPTPPILLSLTLHTYEEIAYTKVRNTNGAKSGCYVVGGREVCSYPVNPLCINTPNPDYNPVGVNDSESWPAWYTLGACSSSTFGGTNVWLCIPTIAIGTTNLTPANCTYNP